MTWPPEKLDVQGDDMQWTLPFEFLTSLLCCGGGWFANPALALWLQSLRPAGRVAELGSLGH